MSPQWLYESPGTLLSIIDVYKGKTQPVAFQIMDEPSYKDWGAFNVTFEDLKENMQWNRLTTASKILKNIASDKMHLFNMAAPNLNHGEFKSKEEENEFNHTKEFWIGGCDTYESYLNTLDLLLKPSCWSYDLYPFVIRGNSGIFDPNVIDHFFHYLNLFSQRYKENPEVPYWTYCMSIAHTIYTIKDTDAITLRTNQSILSNPDSTKEQTTAAKLKINSIKRKVVQENVQARDMVAPTTGMLRFQTFMSLAFGSQGIVYWSYAPFEEEIINIKLGVEGKTNQSTYELFHGGIINMDGSTTDQYDYALWVNMEVEYFTPIFLGSKFVEAVYFGKKVESLSPFKSSFGCVQAIEMIFDDEITEEEETKRGLVMTHLNGGSSSMDHVVIVNQDYEHSQKIRFAIKNSKTCRIYSYPGRPTSILPNSTGMPIWVERELMPGGCIAIEW